MPGESEVRIVGLRDLNRAFTRASPAARKELRKTFSEVAQPVRRDAEGFARSRISHIGDKWPQMRVGVTRTVVYVAPKQRGVRMRGASSRRRPNLAELLMGKAMEPALVQNEGAIEHAVEVALDHVADHFNNGRI